MRPSLKRNLQASVSATQRKALALLWEAYAEALSHQREPWEFAVSFESLRSAGLSESELRGWLCDRLVEHRQELFQEDGAARCFRALHTLAIPENTCVLLSEAGIRHLQALGLPAPQRGVFHSANGPGNDNGAAVRLKPYYDRERRQLLLGEHVVKQFKQPADCQQVIVCAFEEDSWPEWIDDPLTQGYTQEPRQHLHQVIGNLNRHQNPPGVHFRCGGNGTQVGWEIWLGQARQH